jgi:hypothetical protein
MCSEFFWRKLHNEKLHIVYSSPKMINSKKMRWAGHVAHMGENKYAKHFGWKSEGKRLLGKRRRRWEDNIKMDLRDIGFGGVDWTHLARDRFRWWALVNTVMTFDFHKRRGISCPVGRTISFSRRTLLHGVN